jgi:hypothetical protein
LNSENEALKKEVTTLKETTQQEKKRKFVVSPPSPLNTERVEGTVYLMI